MATQLQKKIEMLDQGIRALAEQQNAISVSLQKHGLVINRHADILTNHENAIVNLIEWLGNELGPEAVQRLEEYLESVNSPEKGEGSDGNNE